MPLEHVVQELSFVVDPAANPSVARQDVRVNERHAPVSFAALNIPVKHVTHAESVEADPTLYPLPATHLLLDHVLHTPPLNHVPVAHVPAHTASLLAVPAISGLPAEHVGVE